MGLETGSFSLGSDAVAESLQSSEFNTIPSGKTIVQKGGYFALADETITLHTVTAGKVLWVKQFIVDRGSLSAGSGHIKIGDSVSAALSVDTIYSDAIVLSPDDTVTGGIITFPIPLKILTAFTVQTDSTISETTLGFIGWEENASN